MYFDAVIETETMDVLFNGTPDETVAYLRPYTGMSTPDVHVVVGRTLAILTVDEYLEGK